jgi:nitrite reductase/ring-hydroxylating ferredoxin subunit
MQFLCDPNSIEEDSSKGFTLGSHSIFVVKKDGLLHVYKNQCPHLNIELEWQPHQFLDSENYFIQCSTHGALFEVDTGLCVSGPCMGQHLIKIESRIEDDKLMVDLPTE